MLHFSRLRRKAARQAWENSHCLRLSTPDQSRQRDELRLPRSRACMRVTTLASLCCEAHDFWLLSFGLIVMPSGRGVKPPAGQRMDGRRMGREDELLERSVP